MRSSNDLPATAADEKKPPSSSLTANSWYVRPGFIMVVLPFLLNRYMRPSAYSGEAPCLARRFSVHTVLPVFASRQVRRPWSLVM